MGKELPRIYGVWYLYFAVVCCFSKGDLTSNGRAYPVATEYFVCPYDERCIRVYLAT